MHSVARLTTDSVGPPDGHQPAGRLFVVRLFTARSSHVPIRAVLHGFSAVLHGQAEMSAAFPPSVSSSGLLYPQAIVAA